MKCTYCNRLRHENDLLYTHDTLILRCVRCLDKGIPYNDFDEYLKKNIPDAYNLKGKTTSVRLEMDEIIYLLKYANEKKTTSISETLHNLIGEMKTFLIPLDDQPLLDSPFKLIGDKVTSKRSAVPSFLRHKEPDKEEIKMSKPKPRPKIAPEPEPEPDNDEDVFTI